MNRPCVPTSKLASPPSLITTIWSRKPTRASFAPKTPAACDIWMAETKAEANAAFDLFRRRRAHPTESINDRAELVVLDAQPSAAEALDQRYELEVLAEAVRALPDRCRQVIMLRYLDGLAYKEIADQLGISPETVKVHMAKGMRRCAAFFAARGLLDAAIPSPGEATA